MSLLMNRDTCDSVNITSLPKATGQPAHRNTNGLAFTPAPAFPSYRHNHQWASLRATGPVAASGGGGGVAPHQEGSVSAVVHAWLGAQKAAQGMWVLCCLSIAQPWHVNKEQNLKLI